MLSSRLRTFGGRTVARASRSWNVWCEHVRSCPLNPSFNRTHTQCITHCLHTAYAHTHTLLMSNHYALFVLRLHRFAMLAASASGMHSCIQYHRCAHICQGIFIYIYIPAFWSIFYIDAAVLGIGFLSFFGSLAWCCLVCFV